MDGAVCQMEHEPHTVYALNLGRVLLYQRWEDGAYTFSGYEDSPLIREAMEREKIKYAGVY